MHEEHRALLLSLPPQSCDKCGRPVDPGNNASVVALLAQEGVSRIAPLAGSSEATLMEQLREGVSRHLSSVYEGGEKVCEGSPSRTNRTGLYAPEFYAARGELERFVAELGAQCV